MNADQRSCTIHGSITGRVVASIEGRLVIDSELRDIFTEYRFCGCVTWRLA